MVWYLMFVALSNLWLGFYLARNGWGRAPMPQPLYNGGPNSRTAADCLPVATCAPHVRLQTNSDARMVPVSRQRAATPSTAEVSSKLPEVSVDSLDRWQEHLHQLQHRMQAARASTDSKLTRGLADHIREYAESWMLRLQNLLCRDATDATSSPAISTEVVEKIEMSLAQLETTVSNIDRVVRDEADYIILNQMHREMTTLENTLARLPKEVCGLSS